MSTNRLQTVAATGWSDVGITCRAPLKRYRAVPDARRAAALLTTLRGLVETMKRQPAGERPRSGGPQEPPEAPRRETYLDDPVFWMLVLH